MSRGRKPSGASKNNNAELLRKSILQELLSGDWPMVRLGDLVDVISGVSYRKGDVSKQGIRILRGGNIQQEKIVFDDEDVFLPSSYESAPKKLRKHDIVIVASTGSHTVIGKPGIVSEDYNGVQVGAFLRIVRPKNSDTAKYLHSIFISDIYREHIRNKVKGTNINNIRTEYVTELQIPLPPLEEQHRIVAKIEQLEPLLSKYAILEREREYNDVTLQNTIRKSILQHELAGDWDVVRLGDVAEYRKGPFGSSLTKAMFVKDSPTSYKVYEQKNAIQKNSSLGEYYITESKYNEMKGFHIKPEDIIISCAGTIGESYVLPATARQGIINQALMRVRLNKVIMNEDYFLLTFDNSIKSQSKDYSKGTAINNIPPFKVFKDFEISLPSLSEQHKIVARIDALFEKVNRLVFG